MREKKEKRREKKEKRREKKEKRREKKRKEKKEEPAEEGARQVFVVARNLVVLVPFLPTSRNCAGCWSLPALPLARSLALTWRQGSSSRPLYGR
jgi:hypothetical protein